MLTLIPKPELSVSDIKVLRDLTGESISFIKAAAANSAPIKKYPFFENNWQELRLELKRLVDDWSNREVPFILRDDEGHDQEEIGITDLRSMLQGARSIEQEQEMASDLEMGYIKKKEEFKPHEKDWI